MKRYIAYMILLITTLMACEKIVDSDKLLDTEERVFIRGYISPQDTLLRVHVSKVLPAVGTTFSYNDEAANRQRFRIENAQVVISNEAGMSTTLEYDTEEDNYIASAETLAIVSEQRYFLEVTVDNQSYTTSCMIPEAVPEEAIAYEVIPTTYDFGTDLAGGILSFQDFPEEGNVYALGGISTLEYTFENEPQVSMNNMGVENFEPFLTDNLNNGGTLNARLFSQAFFGDEVELNSLEVTLKVAHLEEIIYQNIRASINNEEAEFELFLEYSVSPNNILDDGAVGIFAGYNLTEKVIDVEIE